MNSWLYSSGCEQIKFNQGHGENVYRVYTWSWFLFLFLAPNDAGSRCCRLSSSWTLLSPSPSSFSWIMSSRHPLLTLPFRASWKVCITPGRAIRIKPGRAIRRPGILFHFVLSRTRSSAFASKDFSCTMCASAFPQLARSQEHVWQPVLWALLTFSLRHITFCWPMITSFVRVCLGGAIAE